MQVKMPAVQACSLSDKPTPATRRPDMKMKSQLSMNIKMTSHRVRGWDVRPDNLGQMRTDEEGRNLLPLDECLSVLLAKQDAKTDTPGIIVSIWSEIRWREAWNL